MIIIKTKEGLINIIKKANINEDLNHIDISRITDLSRIFSENSSFNGDISKWNTSKIINMSGMFNNSNFTGDISLWDTSNVVDMSNMFRNSIFYCSDISKWNTSKVTNMSNMFRWSDFNGDISRWDVSSVTDMSNMFNNSDFNSDISDWNIYKVVNMSNMFKNSEITIEQIINWKPNKIVNFETNGLKTLKESFKQIQTLRNSLSVFEKFINNFKKDN